MKRRTLLVSGLLLISPVVAGWLLLRYVSGRIPVSPPLSTIVEQPQSSFSNSDLSRSLAQMLSIPDLEVADEFTAQAGECTFVGRFAGRSHQGNYYSLVTSDYADPAAAPLCARQKIAAVFTQTYEVSGQVYNRGDSSQPFSLLSADSTQVTSPRPDEYLRQFFSPPNQLTIDQVSQSGQVFRVSAAVSGGEFSGAYVFDIDLKSRLVNTYTYTLEYGAEKIKLQGKATILYQSSPITPPESN